MKRVSSKTEVIPTSYIHVDKNGLFTIENTIWHYELYHCEVIENELTMILRKVSMVRKEVREVIITCHSDSTSTAEFNKYEF